MRFIETKCKKCGADLDVDLNNMIAFCPYCGSKLQINMKNIDKVFIEKEKTIRSKMYYDNESARDRYDYEIKQEKLNNSALLKDTILAIIFLIILGILFKFNLI